MLPLHRNMGPRLQSTLKSSSFPILQQAGSSKIIALNYTRTSRFTMLPHFWLFTILAPLGLGVPVPSESVTPSVTSSASNHDATSLNGPGKMGINRANKAIWNLKIQQDSKNSGQILGTKSPSSLSGTSGGTSNGTSGETLSDGVASKGLEEGGVAWRAGRW